MNTLFTNRNFGVLTTDSFLFLAIISYVLFGSYVLAQTNDTESGEFCHNIQHKHEAKANYGSPFNLFSTEGELLMKVTCGTRDVTEVHLGNGKSDLYIYKDGYSKVGGKWEKVGACS